MHHLFLTPFLLIVGLFLNNVNSYGQKKEYFVQFKSIPNSVDEIADRSEVISFDCPFRMREMQNTFVLTLIDDNSFSAVKKAILQKYQVEYIEAVPDYKIFYTPNDLNGAQYNLSIIEAENAWNIDNDGSDVTIAIVDDAIDLSHPDLSPNIWSNPGEIPGNLIDDDGNGYVDDVNGWDCADGDNDVTPPVSPTMDHGTHVAGISAASSDNGNGIAAISMNSKIIPVKIGASSSGSLQNSYLGVEYAILMQADVINMSWGGGTFSQTYQNLLDLAYANDIVCVAAAGNSSTSTPMYPASYNHVISVAATDQIDMKAGFSNYGSTVDVSAPGDAIYSTVLAPTLYDYKSGTSMAAPLVAGLTALMRSTNPSASVDEIEMCLESTCDPVQGPFSSQMGAGRINAYLAMQCINQIYADFTANFTNVCPGYTVDFSDLSYGGGLSYNWTFPGGSPSSSTAQNPSVTYNTVGSYDVTLEVSDGTNTSTATYSNYINVTQPSATISGNSTINGSGYAPINFNFTGNPPWDVVLSDGTNTFPINGITTSPYTYYVSPGATTTYTISSFNDSQCSGTSSGSADVTFIPGSSGSGNCNQSATNMIQYMGTPLDDQAMGVTKLGTEGYAVIGRQYDGTDYHFYISMLDLCGNAVWEKVFNPNVYGIPSGITFYNNFIYVGGYTESSYQTSLLKIDLNGNIIEAKEWGDSNDQYPRRVIESNDGNLIYGGVSNSTTYSFGTNDFYVMKTDHDGNILWEKHLGASANDFCHNVEQDLNDDILAVGYTRNYTAGLRKGLVMKLDDNGNLLWSKEYHKGSDYTYIGFAKEIGGSYYFSGRSNSGTMGNYDGLIIKTDLDGNVIWSKFYGGAGDDYICTIDEFNGEVYFTGISMSTTNGQDVVVGKIDPLTGNLINYTSLGTVSDDNNFNAFNNFGTDASGFFGIFHGDAGLIGGEDIVFYRFNSLADNCQPSDVVLNTTDANILTNTFTASSVSPAWNFTPTTYNSVNVSNNQGIICSDIAYTDLCSLTAGFDNITPPCFADSTVFYDTTLYDSLNILYLWDFGDGSPIAGTNDTAVFHQYSSAGSYQVELIAVDTTTGCADTVVNSITLTSDPSIDMEDTIGICMNDSAMVQLSLGCAVGYTVIWTSNGPNLIEQTDSSFTATAGSSGMIYLEVTNGSQSYYDSVFIDVDQNCCTSIPKIEVDNNSTFCIDSDIMFNNNSLSNAITTPTYSWQFLPDGIPAVYNGATPPAVSFPTDGQKTIVLEMMDDCGTFMDTILVSIFPDPDINLPESDTLCFADSVQLGDNPIAGYSYSWTPANIMSNASISNPHAWIDSSGYIHLTVTDNWTGCTSQDSIRFNYDSTDVHIMISDTLLCGTQELSIPYNSYNTSDLSWNPTDILTNITLDSATFDVSEPIWVTSISTGVYGCQDTDSVFIDVLPLMNELELDTVKCLTDDFIYYPEIPWLINGETHEEIVITEAGDYYYPITNECQVITHHIKLEEVSCECNVYVPNAFTPGSHNDLNDKFIPSVDCDLIDYEFQIFNRWGEILFTTHDIHQGWSGVYADKLVSDGVYVWTISYINPFTGLPQELKGHVTVLK